MFHNGTCKNAWMPAKLSAKENTVLVSMDSMSIQIQVFANIFTRSIYWYRQELDPYLCNSSHFIALQYALRINSFAHQSKLNCLKIQQNALEGVLSRFFLLVEGMDVLQWHQIRAFGPYQNKQEPAQAAKEQQITSPYYKFTLKSMIQKVPNNIRDI